MAGEASLLRIAYAINILMLVPVCWGMFFGGGTRSVFQGKVAESDGLRLLVGSLWFAILVASALGLAWPAVFAPVLLIQIVYKSVWLLAFALPARAKGGVPWGVSGSFLFIVGTYPVLLYLSGVWR